MDVASATRPGNGEAASRLRGRDSKIDRSEREWYKDAVLYQLHIKAFFDANVNYGYKHLYPTKGLEPGCLSAQKSGDGFDYCQESFRYVRHDYTPATANTGYYYSKIIGTPQY